MTQDNLRDGLTQLSEAISALAAGVGVTQEQIDALNAAAQALRDAVVSEEGGAEEAEEEAAAEAAPAEEEDK